MVSSLIQAIVPLSLQPAQWAELQAAYATPPRAYHHWGHIEAVLEGYAEVAAGPGWEQPREVALALLFHDAIYEPGKRDNEARSADLARETIPRWWPGAVIDVERVAELIALTARHGQLKPHDVDADAALMLDCDMAILAAPPPQFEAYDQAIAEEYRGHVPGFLYRINRRRFLRGVLAQPRIFLSDWFDARCDAQARANLRRAIG
jgi:predicted metal-dependent HD superfamily phosphohydrolase